MSVGHDRALARDHVRGRVASALRHPLPVPFPVEDQAAVERVRKEYDAFQHATAAAEHRRLVPDHLVDLMSLAGTPEEVLERVRSRDDRAADHAHHRAAAGAGRGLHRARASLHPVRRGGHGPRRVMRSRRPSSWNCHLKGERRHAFRPVHEHGQPDLVGRAGPLAAHRGHRVGHRLRDRSLPAEHEGARGRHAGVVEHALRAGRPRAAHARRHDRAGQHVSSSRGGREDGRAGRHHLGRPAPAGARRRMAAERARGLRHPVLHAARAARAAGRGVPGDPVAVDSAPERLQRGGTTSSPMPRSIRSRCRRRIPS